MDGVFLCQNISKGRRMNQYSKRSQGFLNTCHPDLQLIFRTVLQYCDNSILCGYRNKVNQNIAYMGGYSQLQFPKSKHNVFPSLAVDAAPYFVEIKNIDWDDQLAMAKFAGNVEIVANQLFDKGLITHRLRWGGDFSGDGRSLDEKFLDLVHYELIKV